MKLSFGKNNQFSKCLLYLNPPASGRKKDPISFLNAYFFLIPLPVVAKKTVYGTELSNIQSETAMSICMSICMARANSDTTLLHMTDEIRSTFK